MGNDRIGKAKRVIIVWDGGEPETLTCGDGGEVFVVIASTEADKYMGVWSGGMVLFRTVMFCALEFGIRLQQMVIDKMREGLAAAQKKEDRAMAERFIESVLGKEE